MHQNSPETVQKLEEVRAYLQSHLGEPAYAWLQERRVHGFMINTIRPRAFLRLGGEFVDDHTSEEIRQYLDAKAVAGSMEVAAATQKAVLITNEGLITEPIS